MKLTFRGWRRQVFPHTHAVKPVHTTGKAFYPTQDATDLNWSEALVAHGQIEGAALTGKFLIDFEFSERELKNWLTKYIEEHPHKAFKLISAAQSEALKKLSIQKKGT